MKLVTLDDLPIDPDVRQQIRRERAIHGAVMDKATLVVWGPDMDVSTEDEARDLCPKATHAWHREMPGASRVQQAIALMDSEAITANAAAVRIGVDVAAVYRALKLRATRGACPTCGQVLP